MKKLSIIFAALVLLAACTPKAPEATVAPITPTDSIKVDSTKKVDTTAKIDTVKKAVIKVAKKHKK